MSLERSHKRKHITLTLSVKAEILEKLKAGQRMCDLARFYGIGRATIYDLKQNREKIERFIQKTDFNLSHRHTLKYGEFPEVEEALYRWITQERANNVVLSGELIQERARQFYKEIIKKDNFKASNGWLDKFKKRYGICFTNSPENPRRNDDILPPIPQKIQEKLNELPLLPDQMYTVEVSSLFWRSVPAKILNNIRLKDEIAIMSCSNASGKHKLDLFIVGSEEKSWIDNANSPTNYITCQQAIVTKEIFTKWFHEHFAPSVNEFLIKQMLPQRFLLIVRSDIGLASNDVMLSEDGTSQTIFLPQDEDGVAKMVKTHYKKNLIYNIVNQNKDISKFLNELTLESAIANISKAWQSISSTVLIAACKYLWPSHHLICNDTQTVATAEKNVLNRELHQAIKNLCEKLSSPPPSDEEINSWLLDNVEENIHFTEDSHDFPVDIKKEFECVGEDEYKNFDVTSNVLEQNEILTAFNACIRWSEQNEVDANDIGVLERLRKKFLSRSNAVEDETKIESVCVSGPDIKCEFLIE